MTKLPLPANAEQLLSGSYLLPVDDTDFLLRDEMRATRFALEYAKADLLLKDWGIRTTIVVFGSSRVLSPEQAECPMTEALSSQDQEQLERLSRQVGWYQAARQFGQIASQRGGALAAQEHGRDNVIATGGGSGIMEAANRGARDAGAPTIGYTIELPVVERHPNRYVTPELTFRFHYFAMRKMHLAMRANALVVFPGGFGTMDQLFEILTLRQTRKSRPLPIVLFDQAYWRRVIDFEELAQQGMIARRDLQLLEFADTPEDAWQVLTQRGISDVDRACRPGRP